MARKRKDVTAAEKVRYLQMAYFYMLYGRDKGVQFKTDLAGVACQYSQNPKLKRGDFESIMHLTLTEIFI